jgi:hypothetical protein
LSIKIRLREPPWPAADFEFVVSDPATSRLAYRVRAML